MPGTTSQQRDAWNAYYIPSINIAIAKPAKDKKKISSDPFFLFLFLRLLNHLFSIRKAMDKISHNEFTSRRTTKKQTGN